MPPSPWLTPPSEAFGELYVAVAESGIFPDFKQFADAIPKGPPERILAAYRAEKPATKEALEQFVVAHFDMEPPLPEAELPPPGLPLEEHIRRLWRPLTKRAQKVPAHSSLLPVPAPYVVPGGRFREMYYWDSYFTMLGLTADEGDLSAGIRENFEWLIRTYGHIPNANRSYYLSRSQPPFFFKVVESGPGDPPRLWAGSLSELKAEYAYWMQGEDQVKAGHAIRNVVGMPDGSKLNRYWDERDTPRDEAYPNDAALAKRAKQPKPELFRNIRAAAESGWDFSSRWLADGKSLETIETTSIVAVDLNSLLYGLERAIQAGCERNKQAKCEKEFAGRADRRRAGMNRYLWNASAGEFDDYEWTTNKQRGVLSAATLYPLFVGAASDQQARAVAKVVRARLLGAGGLLSTTNRTGQQWDAPNGWAPLQWIAFSGLQDYQQYQLADDVALRWITTVSRVYASSRRLMEKYDMVNPNRPGGGGEYALQDGFGWTNGVTMALMEACPVEKESAPPQHKCLHPEKRAKSAR
jgi:alpha,alpha-trehalase